MLPMNGIRLKAEAHQLIDTVDDPQVLAAVIRLLNEAGQSGSAPDWWDTLPTAVQQEIDAALQDTAAQDLVSTATVLQKLKTRHPNVF